MVNASLQANEMSRDGVEGGQLVAHVVWEQAAAEEGCRSFDGGSCGLG